MTERTTRLGNLITDSIYALYNPLMKERAFVLEKNEDEIIGDMTSYVQSELPNVTEEEVRVKMSLYIFLSPMENSKTLCRML